jgi:peptidoglycan/LPS O-acetylase OafA/YrhL
MSWNIPSWSISTEFAAYLLFPALVLIVRPASTRAWHAALVIGAALLLLNLCFAPEAYDLGRAITTFGVVRCVTQFTMGAVLAAVFLRNPSPGPGVRMILFAAPFLLVLGGLFTLQSVLIPAGWAALVLGLAYNDRSSRLLRLGALVFVAEISYATYMVHYFIRDLFKLGLVRDNQVTPALTVVFAFLVIVVCSIVLYRLVEKPAQRWMVKAVLVRSAAAATARP